MLQLGPLAIRWYGFLIATGVLIGSIWALHAARRRGMDTDKLLDSAFWLVLAGIVGARLVYVLTSPGNFFGPGANPLDAFKVWEGGISIRRGVALGHRFDAGCSGGHFHEAAVPGRHGHDHDRLPGLRRPNGGI